MAVPPIPTLVPMLAFPPPLNPPRLVLGGASLAQDVLQRLDGETEREVSHVSLLL